MTSMIERVARVICWDAGLDPDQKQWDAEGSPVWKGYEAVARAAITAMREPTEAMIEAGAGEHIDDFLLGKLSSENQFKAMIDAALAEKEG